VTRRLEPFKTDRGRWNLEVTQERVEEIERSFSAPAVLPATEQNLIPDSFFPNRLVDELSTVISSETRQAIITESANAQRIFNLADVEGILSDSHSIDFLSASESSALIYFIEKRKSKIVEFVCSAIGLPLLPL
jgi:hypothetical protein